MAVERMFNIQMALADIPSYQELAKRTGIECTRLRKHIHNPSMFRLFELKSLDEVLHFSDEDLLTLVKGGS